MPIAQGSLDPAGLQHPGIPRPHRAPQHQRVPRGVPITPGSLEPAGTQHPELSNTRGSPRGTPPPGLPPATPPHQSSAWGGGRPQHSRAAGVASSSSSSSTSSSSSSREAAGGSRTPSALGCSRLRREAVAVATRCCAGEGCGARGWHPADGRSGARGVPLCTEGTAPRPPISFPTPPPPIAGARL